MNDAGHPVTDHAQPARTGVLLTNLGTPSAPDRRAVKAYLREFLSDPRVVNLPRALWWPILHGVILNVRPARSAAAYRGIWTAQGSPLLVHTLAQRDAVRSALHAAYGEDIVVECAMRYGEPSMPAVLQSMFDQGVRRLLVLPLYPQYSSAATASVFDRLAQVFARRRRLPALRFVSDYHDHPAYIAALADSITAHRATYGGARLLLFSYHGLPQRHIAQGDPYYAQCLTTARLVTEQLGLRESDYRVSFQSRFGREEWLQPYTDATLKALPAQGVTSVQVICPGFAADCLETLEEIAVENRAYFLQAGGERYEYIPCLNSAPAHIAALCRIASETLGDWVADGTAATGGQPAGAQARGRPISS